MKGRARPVHAPDLVTEVLDGIAVVYEPDTDRLHRFNESGSWVWQLCDGTHTIDAICATTGSDAATREVLAFLCSLHEQGLVLDASE